jgi:signal transduction histidine kinase
MDRPLELDLRPADLVALARTAVEERDGATEQHHLRLEAVEPELVGHWDATRLERVLSNLLDNALKYSPAGGDVVLRVCRETQGEVAWAVLEVSDQGVGIPAAEHARIFERFGRAKNVVGRIPGTGIGLAAVRQIVQQLGGTIDVESVEGVGSTFRVRLPLQASPLDGATSS